MGKLDGKVAIVTGGGRGIGRAIAGAYLREDARVTVTAAREHGEIVSLAEEVGAERVLSFVADVTYPEDCERVVAEPVGCFGRVDVLVNNAGRGMKYVSESFLSEPTRFWEVDPDTWKMVVNAIFHGPFLMARAVVSRMIAQGSGSIVNVSMNYETMKRRGFSPYGPSTKAALESEAVIWAQDLEGTGVRGNVLLPGGATETGMIPAGLPEDVKKGLLRPKVVAGPAVYLASDDSRSVTGRRIVATE